jgi:hypothetical protein
MTFSFQLKSTFRDVILYSLQVFSPRSKPEKKALNCGLDWKSTMACCWRTCQGIGDGCRSTKLTVASTLNLRAGKKLRGLVCQHEEKRSNV